MFTVSIVIADKLPRN